MADGGSVRRLFERKGVVMVPKTFEVEEGRKTTSKSVTEDQLMEATIDAPVENIEDQGEGFEVTSDPADLVEVRKSVQAAGIDYDSAEVSFVPTFNQQVDDLEVAQKVEKLVDLLDDLDDVQEVYSNAEYSEAVEKALEEAED